MVAVAERKPAPLSVTAFRAWVESRPSEEHWELINGVPMMMAPPTRDHQRIASNLERLLNDALERHDAARAAYQRVGLNLAAIVENYDPEPDVVVIDVEAGPDQRYADRFYLAAEIVSDSDLALVEGKVEIYRRHPNCTCTLVIRQDRCDVRIDLRTATRWRKRTLTTPDDEVVLTDFGLQCRVADLYRGTSIRTESRR